MLERQRVAEEVKGLDQTARAALRKYGVRFGAHHLYLPGLLKPAPRALALQLWALKHGGLDQKGLDTLPHLAASGRTSIPVDHEVQKALYRAIGYRVVRRARGARRHSGAAGRPDPPGAGVAAGLARPQAGRRGRRHRLHRHRRHDLAGRLLGRGFRLHPQGAGLSHGAPPAAGRNPRRPRPKLCPKAPPKSWPSATRPRPAMAVETIAAESEPEALAEWRTKPPTRAPRTRRRPRRRPKPSHLSSPQLASRTVRARARRPRGGGAAGGARNRFGRGRTVPEPSAAEAAAEPAAESAEVGEPAAPAEPEMIEVWRIGGRHHDQRRPRRPGEGHGRPPFRREQPAAAAGEGAPEAQAQAQAEAPAGGRRFDRPRPDHRRRPDGEAGGRGERPDRGERPIADAVSAGSAASGRSRSIATDPSGRRAAASAAARPAATSGRAVRRRSARVTTPVPSGASARTSRSIRIRRSPSSPSSRPGSKRRSREARARPQAPGSGVQARRCPADRPDAVIGRRRHERRGRAAHRSRLVACADRAHPRRCRGAGPGRPRPRQWRAGDQCRPCWSGWATWSRWRSVAGSGWCGCLVSPRGGARPRTPGR